MRPTSEKIEAQRRKLEAWQQLLHEIENGEVVDAARTVRYLAREWHDLDLNA